jgi:hypothetical protein
VIQGLRAEFIDQVWPQVWAVLARAFKYSDGEFSDDVVYNGVKARDMQVWLDVSEGKIIAAGVTQIAVWPEKKVCIMLGFSADSPELMPEYHKVIETWALAHGIKTMILYGRRGWLKRAKDFGYNFMHTAMSKELGE